MTTHTYRIPGEGQFSFGTRLDLATPREIANEAAEHYHDYHDGWEACWPLDIEVLWSDDKWHRYEVERETTATFYATPKRES